MKALIVSMVLLAASPVYAWDWTDPLKHSPLDFSDYGPYGSHSPQRRTQESEIDDPVTPMTDVTVYNKLNVAVYVTSPNYPGKGVWVAPYGSRTFRRQGDLTLNIQPQGWSMTSGTVSGRRSLTVYSNAPGQYRVD